MSENNNTAAAPVEAAPAEAENSTQPVQETPAQVEKRKYKYKVDGREVEEEFSDEDIKSHLSMSKAATKRFQEAATIKKQSEQLVKMLRENPEAVLNNPEIMGEKKFRDIAEQFILKQIEAESMTPEQKAQREMTEKLSKYEEQERRQKEAFQAEQMQKLEQHYQQDYEQKILEGLKSQDIPKTPRTVKRMAELLNKSIEQGYDLEPRQLAQLVKEDYLRDIQELLGATDGDALLALLGSGVSDKIRKSDLQKLKASQPQYNQVKQSSKPQSNETQKMSTLEWREYMDNKYKK